MSPDCVIAGGGVIGLSAAWRLAQAGLRVTVVDESGGRGASWAAAGLLAPVTELHYGEEALLALNLASAAMYEEFIGELQETTGIDTGFRTSGTLMVARDGDDAAALDELLSFQQSLGLEVESLTAHACREMEPRLSPRIRGGIWSGRDHQVDNRALLEALRAAATAAGVGFVEGRVAAVRSTAGRLNGVQLSAEVIGCSACVIAAGAWSADIDGLVHVLPPLRPVKGQLLQLRGRGVISRNVRGLDVYMVPRADGRLVVGATMEEQGFDLTRTAEAAYHLLKDAYELVPGVLELEMVEHVAGLRPATPDNAPAIGATSMDGLFVATGHFRNGVLLAPITARSIAQLVVSGEAPAEIEAFSPLRFETKVGTAG